MTNQAKCLAGGSRDNHAIRVKDVRNQAGARPSEGRFVRRPPARGLPQGACPFPVPGGRTVALISDPPSERRSQAWATRSTQAAGTVGEQVGQTQIEQRAPAPRVTFGAAPESQQHRRRYCLLRRRRSWPRASDAIVLCSQDAGPQYTSDYVTLAGRPSQEDVGA